MIILVVILVYEDKLFDFIIKILLVVVFLKKVVGVEKGLGEFNKIKVVIVICV